MLFQKAGELWPDSVEAHSNLGNIFYYQGQHEQAEACYRRALRLKPESAWVLNNLGNVLCHLGRHEEARAACEQAVRLARAMPERTTTWATLSKVWESSRTQWPVIGKPCDSNPTTPKHAPTLATL